MAGMLGCTHYITLVIRHLTGDLYYENALKAINNIDTLLGKARSIADAGKSTNLHLLC